MMNRFCELRRKDVINICDGCRLGLICDLVICLPQGCIDAIVVPGCGGWRLFRSRDELVIPWCNIRKIGDDVILVELDSNFRSCRT